MTIVDIHTHMVPEYLPDMSVRTGNNRWPVVQRGDNGTKIVVASGKPFRTVSASAWDAETRIADMTDRGIDIQVVSPMPLFLSYSFPARDALEFGKFINTEVARLVLEGNGSFYGLGIVPLQDPKLAARTVRAIKEEYGLQGIEIGTNVNGTIIGDPSFWPFFEAVASEGLAIFIHPMDPVGQDRVVGPNSLLNLVNFPLETALAAVSLMTGGVLDRFPNLRIAMSHGGGSLLSVLPRLTHGRNIFEDVARLLHNSPHDYARHLYYDTLVYDRLMLDHMIRVFGSDRLMLGSDYPFAVQEKQPQRFLAQLALTDEECKSIQSRNSLAFLGVSG